MATITEAYVSLSTAKLLKEKRFNEPCYSFYEFKNRLYHHQMDTYFPNGMTNADHDKEGNNGIAAPTQQMAMRWLREEHNLHIMVNCIGKVNYDPIVQRFDGKDFEIDGVEVCVTKRINGKWVIVRRGFKTHEYACEAAIKYCLENLI